MNEESAKKALIYVLVAVGIFLLFKPKKDSDKKTTSTPLTKFTNASGRDKLKMPDVSGIDPNNQLANDAIIALTAFIDAYNKDETEERLTELNQEMKSSFGLFIIKTEDEIFVKDMNGNNVLVSKIN